MAATATDEAKKLAEGATRHVLYGGSVVMVFNPNSPRYRYTVTDPSNGVVEQSTRGVTTVLGDIIDKPGLRTWPMNMANGVLFGTKFDENLGEYSHDWGKALIKPDKAMTEEEIHEAFMAGSREWTVRSDKGKDVGTLAHSAVAHYLSGKSATEAIQEAMNDAGGVFDEQGKKNIKEAQKALGCFIEWWTSLESARAMEVERPIYSRGLKYAGTFDLLAEINGKVYMLDIKTTNASKQAPLGIYPEMFAQLGAYSYALREETGIECDDVGIVRIGKDGKLFLATAVDIGASRDLCERSFAFAVRLHDWLEKIKPFLADRNFKSHLSTAGKVGTADVS